MIQITRFVVNMVEENCYVFYDNDSLEAAVIDCGAFYPEERDAIANFIDGRKLKLRHVLNTHAHFDHLFGVKWLCDRYGLGLELPADERETFELVAQQTKLFLHRELPLELPPVSRWLKAGDRIEVGAIKLDVIATPGHTPGGVCYYDAADALLFSGDSLFHHEIGRCDLPGGSLTQLVTALKERILTLPENVKVLPGHGDATTIGEEKRMNPYLR